MLLEHGLDENEGGQVGDRGDDLSHILVRDLHQPTVLLLRGQGVPPSCCHPLVLLFGH